MTYLANFVRFLFGLFAPIITVATGAVIAGWGVSINKEILIYVGGVIVVAGVAWGIFSYGGAAL